MGDLLLFFVASCISSFVCIVYDLFFLNFVSYSPLYGKAAVTACFTCSVLFAFLVISFFLSLDLILCYG